MKASAPARGDPREHVAFAHPSMGTTPAKSSSIRRLLATGTLVLTAATALVALRSALSISVTAVVWGYPPVTLQSIPTYDVPSVLQTGREFLLRTRSKIDWCMDDGGGQTKLALWQCNPNSVNQTFVYNPSTYQIRSVRKPSLCLDVGGTGAQLQNCNTATTTQRFTYNTVSLQIRSPAKPNMCLDDGSGSSARCSGSRFVLYYCDATSANQRFEIAFKDDMQTTQQRVVDAAQDGTTRFQIRAVGKANMCLDDNDARDPGDTQLKLATCNANSPKQIWVWDLPLKRIRSVNKRGLCLDDGGAPAGAVRMTLGTCDASNKNQDFVYDKGTLTFRNPSKTNLCMDDGGVWTQTNALKMQLSVCDSYNANQRFEYVVLSPPAVVDTPPLLQTTREVMLRLRDKSHLCVDDGGAQSEGDSQVAAWPCNPRNENQLFVYDAKTNQLRSARKANLCLDDGGAASFPSSATVNVRVCDPYSPDQRFAYDNATQAFTNPLKTNLCLDDGGGVRAGDTLPVLRTCDSSSVNQRFEVVYRDDADAEEQRVLDAVGNGAKFILRVVGKDNLCLDDGGAVYSGWSQMGLAPCAFDNMNQVFSYDATTHRLRSFAKKGLCVDDGGATAPGMARMTLITCSDTNVDQDFVFDPQQMAFTNPSKPGLCMDDGGAWALSFATVRLMDCDLFSANQHFEFVLLPPLPVFPTPPELATNLEILLRLSYKNSLCVHDGGAVRPDESILLAWACNPSDENQLFVYDASSNQLRSARKPGLCIDDAGVSTSGVLMGLCDPDSRTQRYVYDTATQMFRKPFGIDLCLDDGGVVRGGTTHLTLWKCDTTNPNQHFQIKYRDEWETAQQNVLDAVATGTVKFLIRAVGKKNLCVDDGGGTTAGATPLMLSLCDPKSSNQVFSWEDKTNHIRSVSKSYCIDGTDPSVDLWPCTRATTLHNWTYDKKTLILRNTQRNDTCLDDGNAWAPLTARMTLAMCNVYSPNQRFEFVIVY